MAGSVHVCIEPAPADARRAGDPARGQRGVAPVLAICESFRR
jgi:hypothetical protein